MRSGDCGGVGQRRGICRFLRRRLGGREKERFCALGKGPPASWTSDRDSAGLRAALQPPATIAPASAPDKRCPAGGAHEPGLGPKP